MDNRWDIFKPADICKFLICYLLIVVFENAVFNGISAAIFLPVNLHIQIIVTVSCNNGSKRALSNKPVSPRKREYVLNRNIVKNNAGRVALNNFSAIVYFLPNNARNISNSAERRLHFLHLVRLDFKVIFSQNAVNKLLLFCPFKSDFDLLVHQEVCPILAQLLRHAKRIPFAFYDILAVSDSVIVKVLYIPLIPRFPHIHAAIKSLGDCGISKLF